MTANNGGRNAFCMATSDSANDDKLRWFSYSLLVVLGHGRPGPHHLLNSAKSNRKRLHTIGDVDVPAVLVVWCLRVGPFTRRFRGNVLCGCAAHLPCTTPAYRNVLPCRCDVIVPLESTLTGKRASAAGHSHYTPARLQDTCVVTWQTVRAVHCSALLPICPSRCRVCHYGSMSVMCSVGVFS